MKILKKIAPIIGIVCIVLVAIFLALPRQYYRIIGDEIYHLSGYEFIFHTAFRDGKNLLKDATGFGMGESRASSLGIIALILMLVSLVGCFFTKNHPIVAMASGIALVVASIFFFSMQGVANLIYGKPCEGDENHIILWVAYVSATLLLLAGASLILVGQSDFRNQKGSVVSHRSSYNYLASNKKKEK